MINIDNVMNDVRTALEFAYKGHVCEHQIADDRVEDMVAKVRALVVPAFDEQEEVISKRDMENMQLIGELDELQDEVEDLRQNAEEDEKERVAEGERQAVIKVFDSIANGKVVNT